MSDDRPRWTDLDSVRKEARGLLAHPAMTPRSTGCRIAMLRIQTEAAIEIGDLPALLGATKRMYKTIVLRRTWTALRMGRLDLVWHVLRAGVTLLWLRVRRGP